MPRVEGLGETSLYVTDLPRSIHFYEEVFGFRRITANDRICTFRVSDQQVFLLFKKGATLQPIQTAGGSIPPHDGSGQLHMAFTIPAADWSEWQSRLRTCGIPMESEVDWGHGARSLYFRDPNGHLIELATPGVWD